jgi:TonB family protein
MTSGSTYREIDLPTSWSEERARTIDANAATPSDPNAGLAPGAVLKNRFVLLDCLANGPTSQLFCASDRRRQSAGEADARVALKVVTAAEGREPRALQALRREAAIAQGLNHPNLPHILGIDRDGPHTFLCMELLEGESLAAILDGRGSRPMTRVQALHIVDGVCRALAHVHDQRITHADVKPANILVTPQGEATLLDFGVALGPGASDLPAVRGYTPEYASPEVLGGAEPTAADDIFSLACVAYRMLSGYRAFGDGNARDAELAGLRPARPENLSVLQWRALDRGLAFTRAERQADVAAFLAQLKGARDEAATFTDLPVIEPEATLAPEADVRAGLLRFWPAFVILAGAVVAGVVFLSLETVPTQPGSPPAAPVAATDRQPISNPVTVELPKAEVTAPVASLAAQQASPPAVVKPGTKTAPVVDRRPAIQASRPRAEPAPPATPLTVDDRPAPDGDGVAAAPPEPGQERALPDTAVTSARVPYSSLTVRRYVEPEYPRNALTRRVSGWVDVNFSVDAAGRTRDVLVRNAEPPGVFDDAALAAIRRWRFAAGAPATSGIRVRFDPGSDSGKARRR